MKQMLDQIKKLQEFERGGHALRLMPVSIVGVLSDVIGDVATYFKGAVPIYFDPQPCMNAKVQVDLAFLPGVFKNLLKNAVEHIISLDDSARRVDVYCSSEPGFVVISVHNGGETVPPERIATFFDKFNTTKANDGGTGLGTTYARLVTEARGGSISAWSSAERGTLVSVRLPLV
ncbi:MAG: HAMP domain-containing sensor histidine kinase [Bacteroidetes bacterium]|nr:HAMP domain-containing sensor histidine kinase [Bacteroidota bacterium]